MEKDQLISMIHFLVKREDERAQENQDLKDMVKKAAIRKPVTKLTTLKLGADYEVKGERLMVK